MRTIYEQNDEWTNTADQGGFFSSCKSTDGRRTEFLLQGGATTASCLEHHLKVLRLGQVFCFSILRKFRVYSLSYLMPVSAKLIKPGYFEAKKVTVGSINSEQRPKNA